ncbi:hypothetical protein D3C80_1810730 [compost metagenome]
MQVVHQFGQNRHFRLQRLQRTDTHFAHAVLHGFQLTAQHRQRRAQFMGNIRHKCPAHLLVFFQRHRQLVEILRQFSQLIFTVDFYPGAEISGGQLMGAVHQTLNRREHSP